MGVGPDLVQVEKYYNACLTEQAFVLFYLSFTVPGQSCIACDRCQTYEIRNAIKCPSYKATPGLGVIMPEIPCLAAVGMWAFTLCHGLACHSHVIAIVKLPIEGKNGV